MENKDKVCVFFWNGQFMYVGKTTDTAVHAHHAIQMVISMDDTFEINSPKLPFGQFKAVIFDSDHPHECKAMDNRFILLYIAPESTIGLKLKNTFLSENSVANLPTLEVNEFIGQIDQNISEKVANHSVYQSTQAFLHSLTQTEIIPQIDERILKILDYLNQPKEHIIKIKELSDLVFISPSRLIHLFTYQVGIPIRKYILWLKILWAVKHYFESNNLTEAAMYANFSDAPHFNRTFKKMFGLNPSSILKNSHFIQAYFA